jgi:hypothetical protein
MDSCALLSLQSFLNGLDSSHYGDDIECSSLFGVTDDQRAFIENERSFRSSLKTSAELVLKEYSAFASSYIKVSEFEKVEMFRKTPAPDGVLTFQLRFSTESPIEALVNFFLDNDKYHGIISFYLTYLLARRTLVVCVFLLVK